LIDIFEGFVLGEPEESAKFIEARQLPVAGGNNGKEYAS